MEIKTGQKWQVNSEHFMAYPRLNKRVPELIENGTEFQIMYPEEWHFKTNYGKIFMAKPHEILQHCKCLSIDKIDAETILNTKKKREIKGAYSDIKYKNAIKI